MPREGPRFNSLQRLLLFYHPIEEPTTRTRRTPTRHMRDDEDIDSLTTYLEELKIARTQLDDSIERVQRRVNSRLASRAGRRPQFARGGTGGGRAAFRSAEPVRGIPQPVAAVPVADQPFSSSASEQSYAEATAHVHPPPQLGEFVAGDRVIITNTVKRPRSWPVDKPWTAERERRAVVTGRDLQRGRVNIETDNGHATWRLPKNLRRFFE